MLKKNLIVSLAAAMLLFNACDNSEGESHLKTQQMLDDGNYQGVIAHLEADANSNDDYLALATAYMGQAGYTLLDIIGAMLNNEDDDNLISLLAKNASYNSTLDLQKAQDYYTQIVSRDECTQQDVSSSQQDICLFMGLSAISKISSTINLLAGDISNFGIATDDKLTATTCAMQFALNNSTQNISPECSVVEGSEVHFKTTDKSYTSLVVEVNNESYHYLLTSPTETGSRETISTSGYCSTSSFTPREETYSSNLYACPINEDPNVEDTTSLSLLKDELNNGIDLITGSSEEDSNLKESTDEYKCEVLNGEYNNNSCSVDTTQDIGDQETIDYLKNQNGSN